MNLNLQGLIGKIAYEETTPLGRVVGWSNNVILLLDAGKLQRLTFNAAYNKVIFL